MKHTIKLIIACLFLAVYTGCASETNAPTDNILIGSRAMFVLNQGSFSKTNASLDAIIFKDDNVRSNLFNNLGDVGNDIQLINGKLYIVLDNSDKIEVLDPATLKEIAKIQFDGGSIPWKIKQTSATEAVVSDNAFQKNEMYVIDLTTNTIKTRITANASTIDLGTMKGNLYATTYSNELLKVNPSTNAVTSRASNVGDYPTMLLADSIHNKVIVFSQGGYSPKTPPAIKWLNPETLVTTDSLVYDTMTYLAGYIPALEKKLAFVILNGDIAKLDLDTKKLTKSFISVGSGDGFLGGIYDASKDELYLGRGGYSTNGKVEVYDATTGALKRSYTAGIAPSFFTLYQP